MPKRSYRILVFSMVFLLTLQVIITVPLFAEDRTTNVQEPKITLEQAIKIVKEHFRISESYKEFSSGFQSYDNRLSWSLNWRSSGEKSEYFSAQVDALSGEIVDIYANQSSDSEQTYTLPALTLAEAKAAADQWVKQLAGAKYAKLKFVQTDNVIPLDLYGSPSYSFSWERIENGIAVQGNGARIQINANNGEIMSYSLTWHILDLPAVEDIINAGQAVQVFQQNRMFEMQYYLVPQVRLIADGKKEKVQLVYQLKPNSLIDAVTGKALELKTNQYAIGNGSVTAGLGYGMAEDTKGKSISLTPQELQEIEKNTKLLTKEEAIKAVQKWMEIPSAFSLRTMNLNTDSSLRDTKVWYFEWTSTDQDSSRNITARVDAASGELIGFNRYNPRVPLATDTEPKSVITNKEAQTLAEEFLKKIQPDKFLQTKRQADLSDKAVSLPPSEDSTVSFTYERTVNGIAFPSNGMTVSVDRTTKTITAYNLNWYNLEFPPLSQALSQTKAEEAFLAARPMTLTYILINTNGVVSEAKLVYLPANDRNRISDIMDARTGVFLDWQGKPLIEQPRAHHFTDISGNEAEKEITVLGLAGMFGEYGDVFKPTENITVESLLRSLFNIQNGSADSGLTAEEILKKAKEQGWLKEEINPTQPVSRELFSKILIRYLDLETIAELEKIYRTSFTDTNQSQGYIALITGLGILEVNSQSFEPAKNITRAQAAFSMIRALENRR